MSILSTILFVSFPTLASSLLLPCNIHGFSVSESGFVALLSDSASARFMPLQVADDRQAVQSAEALTLLQMLQGIDLGGATLPPELLQQRAASDSELRSVRVLTSDRFELCLADNSAVPIDSPFEAIALHLRYAVAALEVDGSLFDGAAIESAAVAQAFPCCYTREDAAMQRSDITRRIAGLGERPAAAAAGTGALDVSGFDPAALAPPHAKLAPPPPGSLNANRPPPGVMKRALEIARQKGDAKAIERIEKLLSESDACA